MNNEHEARTYLEQQTILINEIFEDITNLVNKVNKIEIISENKKDTIKKYLCNAYGILER